MKSLLFAATIVVLSLIACGGPGESTPEIAAGSTLVETPEIARPSPSSASPTPMPPESTPVQTPETPEPSPPSASPTLRTPENTLVEAFGYTGVIISENGAPAFGYLFDGDSTEFWEPSVVDVSRAEGCIRQYLESVQNDPKLDSYQQEILAFILNNLEGYRRQYVGIVLNGEKRIWCNAFFSASSFPNWEHVPVDIDGGGRHFWQMDYDPLTDECTNFTVHGES